MRAPSELSPQEDIGLIFYIAEADPYITLEYMEKYTAEIGQITRETPELQLNFLFNGNSPDGPGASNGAFGGFIFKPWSERERSAGGFRPKKGRVPFERHGLASANPRNKALRGA